MKMMNPIGLVVFSALILANTFGASENDSPLLTKEGTKHAWAAPLNIPELPNAFKVTDNLYRGAQPPAEGMRKLKQLGIKTVVNLRAFHPDHDDRADTGLAVEHIFMKTWHPEEEDIVRFLQITTDTNRIPVFVHCQHGADRTGTMCAIYRVVVCGWTKQEAIEEMTQGGFGFHPLWINLIRFIDNLDMDAIKKKAESQ